MPADQTCAFCGEPAEGNYSIHRDGFGVGPEVPLCDACGSEPEPTCGEIWDAISHDREVGSPMADPDDADREAERIICEHLGVLVRGEESITGAIAAAIRAAEARGAEREREAIAAEYDEAAKHHVACAANFAVPGQSDWGAEMQRRHEQEAHDARTLAARIRARGRR